MSKINYNKSKKAQIGKQGINSNSFIGTYVPENTPNRDYWVKKINNEFGSRKNRLYMHRKSKSK